MLKPVTQEEKLLATLKLQLEKGIEDLLAELYEDEKYEGFVDLWPTLSEEKGKIVLEIKLNKVPFSSAKLTNEDAVRYEIVQGKGTRRVK